MCSAPDVPPPPPPVQEVKQPDFKAIGAARRKAAGGTLLTGPTAVADAVAKTGATTLLGG